MKIATLSYIQWDEKKKVVNNNVKSHVLLLSELLSLETVRA